MTSARRGLAVVAVALTLVVSACGGGDAEQEPDVDVTSSTSTDTRSAGGQITACTIVDRDVTDPINPNDRDLVSTLLIGDLTYDGCTIGDVYDVSFGIRVVDSGQDLKDLVEVLGEGRSSSIDGLGDEAFRSAKSVDGETVMVAIGVRVGDHEVFLRNDSIGNTDPDNRVSEDATIAFLEQYVAAIPDDFEAQALQSTVGAACLPADDRTIEQSVDSIQLARGGRSGDDVRCTYLGEHLATVTFSRGPVGDPADFLESAAENDEPVTLAGAVVAYRSTSDRDVQLTIQSGDAEMAYVTVSTQSGTLDPDAIVNLGAALLAASEPA